MIIMCHLTNYLTNVLIFKSQILDPRLLVCCCDRTGEYSRQKKLHTTELHKQHQGKEQVKKIQQKLGLGNFFFFFTMKSTKQNKN